MRICFMEIENFRGIKLARFHLDEALICFIGAGDSSKSTIIDAIEYTLSPNWYLPIDDSDFYNCDPNNSISIKITIKPPHEDFWVDTKFGLCLRGWNNAKKVIVDDPSVDDTLEKVLTVQLAIDQSLAPEWHVVTDRNPKGDRISLKDRQKLGVTRIGDNIASELSWSRGSALSRLTQNKDDAEKIILGANRDLRTKINDEEFVNLTESIEAITKGHEELGLSIGKLNASIDPEIVRSRIGALSLHQDKVPARRLGLGSRRLLAIAAQLQCVSQGSVMLIDEIEAALEPHKIKHLLRVLKSKVHGENSGQFIFTSHHAAVIEELGCGPLFSVANDDEGNVDVKQIPKKVQGTVRDMPEGLLAPKVVVCEGGTEVGLLRAFEQQLLKENIKETFAFNQVAIVDAKGGDKVDGRAKDLKKIGKKVCVFMDSDKPSCIPSEEGINIIAWSDDMKIERRVVSDLPNANLYKLIELAIELKGAQSIFDSINNKLPQGSELTQDNIESFEDKSSLKEAMTECVSHVDNKWFKSVTAGEKIGELLFEDVLFSQMSNTDFCKKMKKLKVWVDDVHSIVGG